MPIHTLNQSRQDAAHHGMMQAGDRKWRFKMNNFTWSSCLPEGLDKFAPGNLIAMEGPSRGGLEMRSNTNVRHAPASAQIALVSTC